MKQNVRKQFWLEFNTNFLCLVISNLISYAVFGVFLRRIVNYPKSDWLGYALILVISFTLVFLSFHKSIDIHARNRVKEFVSVFKNITITYFTLITILTITKNELLDSRYLLVSSYVTAIVISTTARYFLKRFITGHFTKSKTASITGIITTSDIAEDFVSEIQKDWTLRISGIALLDNEFSENGGVAVKTKTEILDIPVVGEDDTYMDWIRSAPLDEVFINLPYSKTSDVQDMVEELEDMGITVHVNIPMLDNMLNESKFDNINCRMLAGSPMATFSAKVYDEKWLVIKRLSDILIGLFGCIISIPIIAIVAIPLLIESPGELIFKQKRVGRNGRIFTCYKLRSMVKDAEAKKAELMKNNQMQGHMFKMENDPRITRVGAFIRKTSIDELPQFFNVVKGDMSLIGTRPPTVDEFNKYESRHKRRLSMRPGITGMWQVSGRSEIQDFEEVVKLDCQYIDEWSPLLDLKIFFKTIVVLLTCRGAK